MFDFHLQNVDESFVSLKDFPEAKGFIIIFSCNHCPYVIGSEERIIALHQKYAPQGYPVIAISSNDVLQFPDDSFENMKKKATQKKFPFHYLYDESQEIARNFGAERTPHVFLLQKDREGNLKQLYSGAIDDNPKFASEMKVKYLEPVMEALLSGKPLPFSTQPAIGCTIKWKAGN